MTLGEADPAVIRRHLAALREALANVRRHAGRTARELAADADLRWAVGEGIEGERARLVSNHINYGT